ncbi:unnamed protein product [Closterium sp. NIES-54]
MTCTQNDVHPTIGARPSRPSNSVSGCLSVGRLGICGKLHTQHRCFSRLDDAWRAEFCDDIELPRRADLLRSTIAIFDLDFDAILSAMYALSVNAEGDCYQCVLPDLGKAAAALGASESGTLPGTAPAQALHTFTLDSGASHCFFCESTTLTPLPAPVPVRLADPSGGPVVARSSTVLLFPAVPSGSLSRLHLPSFSTNLVSTAALQDAMVTTTTPGGQRVSICTCTRTGRHLATFTRRPWSSQVAASCSCRLLSHQTLLWHHRLGYPALPCLRGMHSRLLFSGLPRSLPPLPPSPAPPCLPCIEGRQRATPHSSSFPPTTAPLQTLHMDVWGPARVSGQGRERYFLLVVVDYTRYTTVFPLRNKVQVVDVLICWIRAVRLQLRERFGQDLPVQHLHSDRGGEFSSNLLRDICRGEGILQSFTHPDSSQKNGIAKRHIGLVMEVARFHAVAPHFLIHDPCGCSPFSVAVCETSPTLRWTGEVGDASVLRVWGSRAFVRDTSADKLFARAIPCVFLGFVPDAPNWQFYHPTSRHVLPSQDVTFDELVPFYRLFPYRSAPPPPPPLFLAPNPPPVPPVPPQGPDPSGVSQIDPLPGTAPVEVAVGSGAASGGAGSGGAEPGGAGSEGGGSGSAEPGDEEPGDAELEGVEPGGAELEGAESGGAEPRGAASSGGAGAGGARVTARAGGIEGTTATGPGGARTRGAGAAGTGGVGGAGAGDPTEPEGAGVGGTVARGAGAAGARVVDPGAGGAGGTVRSRSYFFPLLQQPASPQPARSPYTEPASRHVSPVRTPCRIPRSRPPPVPGMHAMALRPSSVPLRVPLPVPPESSLPEVPDPESDRAHAASPTVSRLLTTVVTDPSFESVAASSLVAELLDFAAACCLDYATALVAESASPSPPSVGGECALGTDVLEERQEDFECLAAAVPRFDSMLLAPEGDPDEPDIPTLRSYAEAITGPYSSQWQAALDAEMASWKSTGTYVDKVPPPGANIVDGMWIFRVKRPPGSPPAFKTRYVSRGFSQQQGRDYELHSLDFSTAFLQGSLHEEIWLRRPPGFTGSFPAGTQWSLWRPVYDLRQAPREWQDTLRTTLAALGFTPSTADPLLFLRTDTSLPRKRYSCTDLGELRSYLGLEITRDRARRTITLTQSHMVHQVLQGFAFQFSSPEPTPMSTSHSLSSPPSDESVERSGPYPELVGCLMYLMTCTRADLAYPLSLLARYVAPSRHQKVHWDVAKRVLRYLCSTSRMGLVLGGRGPVVLTGHTDASWADDLATHRSSQGYTFSLGSSSVSWRSTRSSSVLSSSCEAEIYAEAMAAQELRWLTLLLTDLGEQPRSPPILAHQVTLAWHDNRHRRPHHLCGLHTSFSLWGRDLSVTSFSTALYCPTASATTTATAAIATTAATLATAPTAAMASPTVLTFDAEGRAVDFDVWVDDLQLFLQCDSRDGVSLFDHTSGVSTTPAATANSTVRSQWTTRDAVARLAVRSHLPPAKRAHFGQYKTAQSVYDAVVARYSSPATAALSRLMLPYLFPDLAAFATVADLVAHLRTSTPPPPKYITLYYLLTRLPDSLSSVRDHFLSLCPTELTNDLLEERLAAAEKSILAVGASRGDRRTPFFEGCSLVPLLPFVASAAAVDLVGTTRRVALPLAAPPPFLSGPAALRSRPRRPLLSGPAALC